MDKEKAQQLHTKYAAMLQRVAFSYLKNACDAEDILQEVYIKLLQCRQVFENDEHARAWLLRVTINLCKDMCKSARRRKEVLSAYPLPEQKFTFPAYGIEDDLLELVLKLPDKYRLPLYLFYYEGYSVHEVAQMLELPEATVKTHLKRGREAVKKQLEE